MLKGTATIELTDIKTGEKQIYKEDNLVTNAISDIFTYNPFGMRYRAYSNNNTYSPYDNDNPQYPELNISFAYKLTPILNKLIGGVVLFDSTLDEDPDKYYQSFYNEVVGYSSDNVNTTSDPKRGSLNLNESKSITNGYRFVFDFNSSQANGIINSICLTSSEAGKKMHGSSYLNSPTVLCVDQFTLDSKYFNYDYVHMTSLSPENECGYFAHVTNKNQIKVGKIKIPFFQMRLNDNLYEGRSAYDIYDVHYLTTTNFASSFSDRNKDNTSSNSTYYKKTYSTLIDGGSDYIWGFQHKNNNKGNSSGNAILDVIKINKNDWSFEEIEWEIPNAQLSHFGEYNIADTWYYDDHLHENRAVIKDGRLYVLSYDLKKLYAIDINNPEEKEPEIIDQCDGYTVSNSGYHKNGNYYYNYSTIMNFVGGTLTMPLDYFTSKGIHGRLRRNPHIDYPSYSNCLNEMGKPCLQYGPYIIGFCQYDYDSGGPYIKARVYLPLTYLATINNLSEPIVKEPGKTMKIIYEITES